MRDQLRRRVPAACICTSPATRGHITSGLMLSRTKWHPHSWPPICHGGTWKTHLLVAATVKIKVNHSAGTVCVAGVIVNAGYVSVSGPFEVAIGITYVKAGVTISSQEIFEVPEGVSIPGRGGRYTTPCSTRELIYRDEDYGALYELEVLVDVRQIVDELDEGNNHLYVKWWTVSPTTAKAPTPTPFTLTNDKVKT